MENILQQIGCVREGEPDDVFAWVNVSAITDFLIAAEAAIRDRRNQESSRKHIEALIKEAFKDGD